jgi:DNA-binding beta-propeller fold protein YncE
VTVSADGSSVYVSSGSSNALIVFDRNVATGALTQKTGTAGCVSNTGSGGACVDGLALSVPQSVVVSADGRNVYSVSAGSAAVTAFSRAPVAYDIDGNGEVDTLTDTMLLMRYSFGFTGDTLIDGAVDTDNCTRCTAPDIEAFIEALGG